MEKRRITRRKFVRDSALVTAGVAASVGARGAELPDTKSIRSYNEKMQYRPLGKTGVWVSAVCLGGHWKRVNLVVPDLFKGRGWLSADLNSKGFEKNRYDIVTQCIERGINYIDACTM